MYDYYVCRNPECGTKTKTYHRFCPMCNSEKSMTLVVNGLVVDVLTNLVSETSKATLDRICDNVGTSLDHSVLFRYLNKEF